MAKIETGAPIAVIAKAMGFFGRLIEQGERFSVPDEEAFAPSWMEKVKDDQAAAPTSAAPSTGLRYVAKHIAGGSYAAVDSETGNRASRLFKKDEGNAAGLAQEEANRLNAGGEILLDVASPATSAPPPPVDPDDDGHPDA